MTASATTTTVLPRPRFAPVPLPAELRHVTVADRLLRRQHIVLHDVSFAVRSAEVTSVLSRHDTTAATVLDLIAGRAQPAWGSVTVAGREVTRLGPDELVRLRREEIGRVWPAYGVQPRLTVRQNLLVAQRRCARPADHSWVDQVTRALALGGMLGYRSGDGVDERRLRWAVAHSIATRPAVVLVDDVTTRLDRGARQVLVEALQTVAHDLRVAVLVATRDPLTAAATDRVVRLTRGRIADDTAA
jgi:putative ABC transport system ATP-binding protein